MVNLLNKTSWVHMYSFWKTTQHRLTLLVAHVWIVLHSMAIDTPRVSIYNMGHAHTWKIVILKYIRLIRINCKFVLCKHVTMMVHVWEGPKIISCIGLCLSAKAFYICFNAQQIKCWNLSKIQCSLTGCEMLDISVALIWDSNIIIHKLADIDNWSDVYIL